MQDCGFTRENKWFRYRAAAIIIEEDCVLFAGNEIDDYYYSIGGGVHVGETSEQAVKREVLEETGVEYEIYLRTQLAYYSGHNHGALGYMNADIYNEKHNDEKFKNLIQVCIEENKRTLVVKHHNEKHNGKFPIWVIVEFFSMGMLSYFYADMLSVDQKHIAKALYETSVSCLKSWLRCITELRNRCAHYSRLYYWSFPALPKIPKEMELSGNRELFSQILVLKLLYPDKDEWNNSFLVELNSIVEEYEHDISLKHIGFPQDWYVQLVK